MLPDWTQALARIGYGADERLDLLRRLLRRRSTADTRLQIVPYRGFGNEHEVYVKGRVLLERQASDPPQTSLQNVLATYRRFHSREIPGKKVAIFFENARAEAISDNEGYFATTLKIDTEFRTEVWRDARFETEDGAGAMGRVFIPPATAKFGVISDLDDTVIVSHATHLPKMLYALLLKNARERVAFPGVAALYRTLEAGTANEGNPLFYVSSGPWNLYDLLVDFLQLNRIPDGPLFLQDYGLERDRFIMAGHHNHKRQQIERILRAHPRLPFILIGDSGQQDPEIYAQILEEMPARILAVYIRDVTRRTRDAQVEHLCTAASQRGADMLLVRDSLEAARHAAARGFISSSCLSEISGETDKDLMIEREPDS